MTEVEGGLDEPAELEPEQGSLDLASPEDDHERAEREEELLRRLRRGRPAVNDDPTAPRGTSEAGRRWTVCRPTARHRRPARRAGHRRPLDARRPIWQPPRPRHRPTRTTPTRPWSTSTNGVTSLWLKVEPAADLRHDALLEGRAAGNLGAGLGALRAGVPTGRRHRGSSTPTPGDPTPPPTAPTWWLIRSERRCAWFRDRRWRRLEPLDLVQVAELARDAARLPIVVDATVVHDLGASDAQELGYLDGRGCGVPPNPTDAGIPLDDVAGLVESATPPPTSSSRRSPSCAPRGASGPACWS